MSDVEGLAEVADLLDGLARRGADLRPAWRSIADSMRSRERDLFDARGRGMWPPLNASTIARKGGRGQILVETGGLLASLTRRGDRYAVERSDATSLTFGTANPVTNLLRRGVRGAPARDPLPWFQEAERAPWADQVLSYLVDGT